VNADRALVLSFVSGGRKPTAIASNPLARDLCGQLLEIDASGTTLLSFVPSQQFAQGAGLIQGGIVTTMLDFAMAFAAHARLSEERAFVTASLSVNLLRAVVPGPCLARGRITRAGRTLLFAAAELHEPHGDEVLANASAVLVLTGPRAAATS
jgi:uncharacterized protein (TIGR00369 family)